MRAYWLSVLALAAARPCMVVLTSLFAAPKPGGPGSARRVDGGCDAGCDARKTIYETHDFAAFVRAGRAGTWLAARYNTTPITDADLEDPFFLMFPWHE